MPKHQQLSARRFRAPELYADGGLWERWPVRHAHEIDLARWVDRHTGPGSQLEMFGEAGEDDA